MAKVPQTGEELEGHLKDHIGFLKASSDAFDGGCEGEAKRLAVAIRVLLHDTNSSQSLLGQISRKDVEFVDTAMPNVEGNALSYGGLVMHMADTNGTEHVAMLDDTPAGTGQRRGFDDW